MPNPLVRAGTATELQTHDTHRFKLDMPAIIGTFDLTKVRVDTQSYVPEGGELSDDERVELIRQFIIANTLDYLIASGYCTDVGIQAGRPAFIQAAEAQAPVET